MDHQINYKKFQNFWIEQQKTAKHMDPAEAFAHIEKFIKNHNTCGFATGYGEYIRCTPIEYTYMNGEFWFVSEGGNKFIGLEKNKNVSLAIFEYYGDVKDSHGLQVMGTAVLYNCYSDEFKKLLAFKGIPYDALKAAKVEVAAVRVIPNTFEMYDTDFVKAGYDVRQTVKK
ncbi:MAG: pyridoxamine 5'-phosphate oxidase family protein [Erysipelotrichales bacterium]|nr:pyridoxamine 5'-phosphate oxidase family protein [Erysipelotrichales bacterium]